MNSEETLQHVQPQVEQLKRNYIYTPLNELTVGDAMNFYGRVVTFKPPTPTRGTDYIMALVVIDDSIPVDDEVKGLAVNIFKKDLSQFPPITQEDDIVQFRHIKVQYFQSNLQALASHYTTFTVFHRNEQGVWEARPCRPVEGEEKIILDRISARTGHVAAKVRSSPTKSDFNRSRLLTVDMIRPNVYFDLIAQVIKILPSTREDHQQVILTDYTSNQSITLLPSMFDFSIDLENRLLITSFWDQYAKLAIRLQEGQIIKVINLKSREWQPDDSAGGVVNLTCSLHGDGGRGGEKIFILSTDSSEAHAILYRRQVLLGEGRSNFNLDQQIEINPFAVSAASTDANISSAAAAIASSPQVIQSKHFDQSDILFATQPTIPTELPPLSTTPSTTILHSNIKMVPIKKILDQSKEGENIMKYVIKGRIIKFIPSNLHNFCRSKCPKCTLTVAPKRDSTCSKCNSPLSDFHFLFILCISDGTDLINVHVAGEHAIKFFNGLTPCNLRANRIVFDYIERMMDALINSPIPSPFCIYSHPSDSGVKYFLFDTLLSIV